MFSESAFRLVGKGHKYKYAVKRAEPAETCRRTRECDQWVVIDAGKGQPTYPHTPILLCFVPVKFPKLYSALRHCGVIVVLQKVAFRPLPG